jgi:hypothetical protein
MKPVLTYLVFFIIASAILLSSQCKKPKNEILLPPETQTGANVIGFKADGKIYIAKYAKVSADYLFLTFPYPYSNGYFLTLWGKEQNKWVIGILTDSLQVFEGQIYPLNNYPYTNETAWAVYKNSGKEYYTREYLQGELKITKLDSINKIISGTFWFDAIDTLSNTTVQIREGRFDLQYTE